MEELTPKRLQIENAINELIRVSDGLEVSVLVMENDSARRVWVHGMDYDCLKQLVDYHKNKRLQLHNIYT